jgi:3-oxoacyl-[acyl-carrier-protein] synthase-3
MSLTVCNDIIRKSGISVQDIGLIVVASYSQDYLFPPMSAKLHKDLNASKKCQTFDINTNCTGLVTGMTLAAERMKSDSNIRYAIVIGVEVLSRFTNLEDQDTAIFFSDGASGVLLGQVGKEYGLVKSSFLTDSSTYESVRLRGGGSSFPGTTELYEPAVRYIEQNGLATWKQAVTNLPIVIDDVLKASNLPIDKIDFFVFHQANSNLIHYVLKKMKVPVEKNYNNVEEIGNTGAASIGIAMSEANEKGLIKPGSYLLMAAVGAGFNFGANIWRME